MAQGRPVLGIGERRLDLLRLGRFEGPQEVADKIFSHGKTHIIRNSRRTFGGASGSFFSSLVQDSR
jgi:hypothetical protein